MAPSELSRLSGATILFDLDGTLVDTVETRIEGWMRTFDEIGIDADRSHVARLIGADGKRLAREVAAAAGREITVDRAEGIDRRAGEVYGELNTDPRPLPGAQHLLHSLERSNLPWAIATSSRAEQVHRSVDALGLARQPRIVDGSHVEHAKPEPDLLLLGAKTLGVDPTRCWYVGDATWDVSSAIAAGMLPIAVTAGSAVSAEVLDGAGAVLVVETLRELIPRLTNSD